MGRIFRNWTRRDYDYWFGVAWCVCHSVAILVDLWLVFSGRESISSMVWRACREHDTITAAGMLACVGIAMLVRRYRWMVFFTGVMGGHLFTI